MYYILASSKSRVLTKSMSKVNAAHKKQYLDGSHTCRQVATEGIWIPSSDRLRFGCSYVLPDDFEESPFLQPSHRR